MKKKVLIIDDDKDFAKMLAVYLRNAGYITYYSFDASIGISMSKELMPDIIISDMKMPFIDGLTVFSIIRDCKETSSIPFIIISGEEVGEDIKLKGYEKGIDDYLTKPFSLKILEAKIKKILDYKENKENLEEVIEIPPIKIYEYKKEVYVGDKRVNLTKKEYEVLSAFVKNPGRVFSPDYLLQKIWGYDLASYNNKHTVEVHISSIRKKLGPEVACKIKNLVGFGYKFEN